METENQIYKELQSGTTLLGGKYVIEKKIGEGGFGITYRAIQSGLNRAVCIKEYFLAGRCVRNTQAKTVQLQGTDEDLFEKYRLAFVKEAQTLAAMHHPGIVEVIDIFDENNTSYMVMPFVEGRSLQSIVDEKGPLDYPEAVNYIAQIANAVGYIHERHILHRDIKPDNIMITADYKAVLIDFGSAREFEEDKTQAQTSMVTHGYAPTEQYTRNSRKGAYTDIYAIGATLYFILTGKVPLEAAARITETMPEPKELNPSLPEEANRTIMKAMQIKPQDRHQSIAEFMNDLRNVNPSTHTVKEKMTPSNRRKKKTIILIFFILFAAILSVVFLVFHSKSNDDGQVANEVASSDSILSPQQKNDSLATKNTDEPQITTKENVDKTKTSPKEVAIDGAVVFFIQNPNTITEVEMANPTPTSWIYYEEDCWEITKEQMKTIDVIARRLNNLPEEYVCKIVGIHKYTGSDMYLQKISEKRAKEVGTVFVEKYGISRDRISVEGKGKTVSYGLWSN